MDDNLPTDDDSDDEDDGTVDESGDDDGTEDHPEASTSHDAASVSLADIVKSVVDKGELVMS